MAVVRSSRTARADLLSWGPENVNELGRRPAKGADVWTCAPATCRGQLKMFRRPPRGYNRQDRPPETNRAQQASYGGRKRPQHNSEKPSEVQRALAAFPGSIHR